MVHGEEKVFEADVEDVSANALIEEDGFKLRNTYETE